MAHENHTTDEESSSTGYEAGDRLELDIRGEAVLNMEVIASSREGLAMTCTCCEGPGTMAVTGPNGLTVDSYGAVMRFAEHDYEVMERSQTTLQELVADD